MSILAALLLAQAATPAAVDPAAPSPLPAFDTPPSEAVAEEILVIGRKMAAWKGGVYKKDGRLACRIRESSGEDAVDAIRCGAMLRCFATEEAEFDRIAGLSLPTKERNRMMQALAQTLTPCLDAAHDAGMRFLAESRVTQ